MRTDDLIDLLARHEPARPPRRGVSALLLSLALAVPVATLLMAALLGINPQLRAYLELPMFWVKAGFGLALAASAALLVLRLARPGVRTGAARYAPAVPVLGLWLLALAALVAAPAGRASELVFGSSWRSCPPSILALSLPVLAGALLALRRMAPTRLAAAGAAAGLLAGGLGAAIYALHCPELAAPFLATWYVVGALLPMALGAWLGPRVLRW